MPVKSGRSIRRFRRSRFSPITPAGLDAGAVFIYPAGFKVFVGGDDAGIAAVETAAPTEEESCYCMAPYQKTPEELEHRRE